MLGMGIEELVKFLFGVILLGAFYLWTRKCERDAETSNTTAQHQED